MSAYLKTEAIEAAHDAKTALEAAAAASDAAKAEAATIAGKVAAAEKALASGTPTVRAAWQKTRGEHELADARARSCHEALREATTALTATERAQNGAWNQHAELLHFAHVVEVERVLRERDALILQAAAKWDEANTNYTKNVFVARKAMRLPHEPWLPTDSLEIFDRAGRSAAFREPPPARGLPCSDAERAEYRHAIGIDREWGQMTDAQRLQLAHVLLSMGARAAAGALGLQRWNTSDRAWFELAHVPVAARPGYLSSAGEVPANGEAIEAIKSGLGRALAQCPTAFDEDAMLKRLGMRRAPTATEVSAVSAVPVEVHTEVAPAHAAGEDVER